MCRADAQLYKILVDVYGSHMDRILNFPSVVTRCSCWWRQLAVSSPFDVRVRAVLKFQGALTNCQSGIVRNPCRYLHLKNKQLNHLLKQFWKTTRCSYGPVISAEIRIVMGFLKLHDFMSLLYWLHCLHYILSSFETLSLPNWKKQPSWCIKWMSSFEQ